MPVRRVGRLVLDRIVDNFFAETEQVAFCTQNIVPGIDFTNDPLLQGRNFSYLDTQLKRLGGPNFTHLPVNAPKCPVAHFQQDGHMAIVNPVGRVNYEPNSWAGEAGGPREDPGGGFRSYAEAINGTKRRVRSERFADHYSQARQFYVSQTPVEQTHIVDAFVFELSKCEQAGIRARMVANLRNVDEDFARRVADGLRLDPLPEPSHAGPAADRRPAAVTAAEHRRQRARAASPAARSACSSPTAPTPRCSRRCARRRPPRARWSSSSPPHRRRRHQRRRAASRPTRRSTAARRCSTTPWSILASAEGAAAAGRPTPTAKDFVTDAHAHCKFIAYTAERRGAARRRRGRRPSSTTATSRSTSGPRHLPRACRDVRYWARSVPAASPDGA